MKFTVNIITNELSEFKFCVILNNLPGHHVVCRIERIEKLLILSRLGLVSFYSQLPYLVVTLPTFFVSFLNTLDQKWGREKTLALSCWDNKMDE